MHEALVNNYGVNIVKPAGVIANMSNRLNLCGLPDGTHKHCKTSGRWWADARLCCNGLHWLEQIVGLEMFYFVPRR